MQSVDQLLIPRWLIPIDAAQSVHSDYGLAIKDDAIVAVAPLAELKQTYSAAEEIQLGEHALLPGLVNAHTHAAMTLLRGFADDLPLMQWLRDYIWPTEQKWVDAKFVEIGTDLAIAEMLLGGTTCFNDMYFFPEISAKRAENAGIRACVGLITIDFPSNWAQNADEYLDKGLKLRDDLRHSPLVTTAFAPHAPYTVSDEVFEKIRTYADETDAPIHIHLHETQTEIAESLKNHGVRPLQRLMQLELVGPRLCAVHMVHLTDQEIATVAEHRVKVVHCPQSNLKLASGFCAVGKLQQHGVSIGIGSDGASSNNDLDMFAETQTAALLAKGVAEDPGALPAYAALEAATLGSARALGLEAQIGSLETGKKADLIAVNLAHCATQPVYHPVANLVYATSRSQVSDVWVGGKRLLQDHQLRTVEQSEVIARARELAENI